MGQQVVLWNTTPLDLMPWVTAAQLGHRCPKMAGEGVGNDPSGLGKVTHALLFPMPREHLNTGQWDPVKEQIPC